MEFIAGLTEQQVTWAKQHDWFGSAFKLAANVYRVYVFTEVLDCATGIWQEEHKEFDNIKELKAWAGY